MVLIACGGGLAGCDTLSSLNPFDRTENYKPEIVPEVPAEQLYNQGLARLEGRRFRRRGEEVRRSRQAIALFGMVAQER